MNRANATEDYALGAELFRQMLYDTERVRATFFAGDGIGDMDRDPVSGDMWVAQHAVEGRAWIDQMAIDVLPQPEAAPARDPLHALIGGEDVSDGAEQLRQVGRCLNWLVSRNHIPARVAALLR